MGNGNAKFAANGHGDGKNTYSGWNHPMQTNGGAQHQPPRRYSTTSEESIDDDPAVSPLSSRRASPSRASVLAPLSRESTALSLGQRIALHAARQEPWAQSPPAPRGPPSARILPQEPNAFESNGSQKRLQTEREISLFPRAPLTHGGFLDVESSREAPVIDGEAKRNSYWVPDRGSEKPSYGQEIGNFHSEEKTRSRRGVSFALHDEILQERSSTFVLPVLKRTDSHQSVSNGAPPQTADQSSRLPVIGSSRRENRPQSSTVKKIQVGTTTAEAVVSHQHLLPQGRLSSNNSTLQKATAVPPPATTRPMYSQWPTDDDSTSGIGSSTGSITSHMSTRYPQSSIRPKHSTSLPSLNSKDTSAVPWSDSELLLPRPSMRIIPPANANSVEANFYHIYHHGIPKKRKKWVLRP